MAVASDLNKIFGGSTDLAKKRYESAYLPPLFTPLRNGKGLCETKMKYAEKAAKDHTAENLELKRKYRNIAASTSTFIIN